MKINFKNKSGLIMLLLFTFLTSGIAQAQPQGQQQGKHGLPPFPNSKQITTMVNEVSTELSLSTVQKAQVSDLYFAHFKQAQSILDKNPNPGESQRNAMDKLRKDFDKQVNAVLTKDQQTKFVAYQKKHNPQKGGQPPK